MIRLYSTLTVEPAHSSHTLTYVSAFLHHIRRSTSSLYTAPPIPPPDWNETTSLSPPFALAISISSTGVIACATASGHVFIGYGGSKTANSTKRKKPRKWNGLKSDESIWFKAAEGAVVSVYVLFTCFTHTCEQAVPGASIQRIHRDCSHYHSLERLGVILFPRKQPQICRYHVFGSWSHEKSPKLPPWSFAVLIC